MSKALVGIGFAAIATAVLTFGSFYKVDQGERGVVLRNGAIVSVNEPGLGFKMPIIDSVAYISTQSRAKVYENVMAYSADQQSANLVVSINYSIPADKAAEVYSEYTTEDNLLSRLVERKLQAQVKNVFGQFNAARAVTERAKLNADIQIALQEAVDGPVVVEAVQVENIDFSDNYEAKIEERMSAEIEVQKLKQNLERERVQAEITVTQAQASADAVEAQAKAQANATRMRGEAEADAIRAKGAALRDNPTLIDLTAAERWNGTLPTTMVPGGATPFVSVK